MKGNVTTSIWVWTALSWCRISLGDDCLTVLINFLVCTKNLIAGCFFYFFLFFKDCASEIFQALQGDNLKKKIIIPISVNLLSLAFLY